MKRLFLLALLAAFSLPGFAAEQTLTGCLSGPNEGETFTLNYGEKRNKTSELAAAPMTGWTSDRWTTELKGHVNQEVMVTGRWFNVSTFEISGGRSKTKSRNRLFAISKIEKVSDSCAGGAGSSANEETGKRE